MHSSPIRESRAPSIVSTGSLPRRGVVQALVIETHRLFRDVDEGALASYIPALARAPRSLFGLCLTRVDGASCAAGDSQYAFSIQSISKPFVFALVCDALGAERVRQKIGVNNSGLAFDSALAIELNEQRTVNAMVNAGAIAVTSLAPGVTAAEKWRFVRDGLARFAGRELALDEEIFESESAANHRNHGLARLLESYGAVYCDAAEAVDVYTRQCSLRVTTEDLAAMGATLADGGVNPLTQQRVVPPALCKRVLAVLATAGMYERSGDWLYDVGLPGKSGVSGGIVTIAPGKGGLAAFSPLIDRSGSSVRGQLATTYLSERLGLNLFASRAAFDGDSS